jgi:hypothetical protein
MNNALCITIDEDTSLCDVQTRSLVDDGYSTEPLAVVKPTMDRENDDEAVYTSFEEAISDRVIAVHSRLERLSHPDLTSYVSPATYGNAKNVYSVGSSYPLPSTTALQLATPAIPGVSLLNRSWIRRLTTCGLALFFLLLGFDLMGLLVLSGR